MKKRRRSRKPITAKNKVNIVLPVYGEPEFLQNCLDSLYTYDAGVPFTTTLVDDLGPDQDALSILYVKWAQKVRLIRHKENLGFAATCNTGARKVKEDYILLLNTDTRILHDGWLKSMVDEMENDRSVGVVGALLSFPNDSKDSHRPAGKTQHAGVAFDVIGRPYHIFLGWDTNHEKIQTRREMNCVTGACMLIRRSLWKQIGGLDTDYTRGNFEDVQFCVQARLLGNKIVYTPEAHLEHFAGGSGNTMTAKQNATLFQLKMGNYVEYDDWRYW